MEKTRLEEILKSIEEVKYLRKQLLKGKIVYRWFNEMLWWYSSELDEVRRNNWVIIKVKNIGEESSEWLHVKIRSRDSCELKSICNCCSEKIAQNIEKRFNDKSLEI